MNFLTKNTYPSIFGYALSESVLKITIFLLQI